MGPWLLLIQTHFCVLVAASYISAQKFLFPIAGDGIVAGLIAPGTGGVHGAVAGWASSVTAPSGAVFR
jgi:hypothetical protein